MEAGSNLDFYFDRLSTLSMVIMMMEKSLKLNVLIKPKFNY